VNPVRVIVAVSGASGAIYAERLLKSLLQNGHEAHVVLSTYGARLLKDERDLPGDARKLQADLVGRYGPDLERGRIVAHTNQDLGASPASGSFLTRGMVVIPASQRTVCSLAVGTGETLIDRAAMVTLKERRPLIVVPREAPFHRILLKACLELHDAGATILPASPGFYQEPKTFEDLGDFIAARVLDHLGLAPHPDLVPRWEPRP
jgi:4-hydroxy-3-polyprenylbenzoate decarboxylase